MLLFAAVRFAALESGFWIGPQHHRASGDEKKRARGDVTLGSMLALLGLMLAFTYAFSLRRTDMRKQAIVNEANAIGTAFLRADLAAEPGRSELRESLLDYARTRVVTADMVSTHEKLQQVMANSEDAQARLWPATKQAPERGIPGPIQASMVQAVNEVLDAHTKRIVVVSDRLPGIAFVLLILIAAASLAVATRNAGLNGSMNRWRMSSFALVLAALMLVIVDFDRGRQGFIQINDHVLELVIRDMG